MSLKKVKLAEYIWLDGAVPCQGLRSKARIIHLKHDSPKLSDFPEWSFDGSSTNQAEGGDSDCILKPVCFVKDSIRGQGNYLVLCEVFDSNGNPHPTNNRARLRSVLDAGASKQDAYIGFEQEYTLYDGAKPLGFPDEGFPQPQGPFYCGVGADRIFGRELVEDHAQHCVDAGIMLFGINAEVMPGQWEYQIGYRGFDYDNNDPLTTCDHMWIAAWLLYRLGEEYDIIPSFDNKPVKGDWNGAGCHTNFSTKDMRDSKKGAQVIEEILVALEKRHDEHIKVYGHKLDERLTGLHETCSIDDFKSGVADRGASIRIPRQVQQKGYGYLEDRRPGANSDPYMVVARILTTICALDEVLLKT